MIEIPLVHANQIARLVSMYDRGESADLLHEISVMHASFLPSVILYCHRYFGDDRAEAIFTAVVARLADWANSEPF